MDIVLEAVHKGRRASAGDTVPCGAASVITRAQLNIIRTRLKSLSGIVEGRASWRRNMNPYFMSKYRLEADVSELEGNPQPPINVAPKEE